MPVLDFEITPGRADGLSRLGPGSEADTIRRVPFQVSTLDAAAKPALPLRDSSTPTSRTCAGALARRCSTWLDPALPPISNIVGNTNCVPREVGQQIASDEAQPATGWGSLAGSGSGRVAGLAVVARRAVQKGIGSTAPPLTRRSVATALESVALVLLACLLAACSQGPGGHATTPADSAPNSGPGTPVTAAGQRPAPKAYVFRGVVEKVDAAAKTLTVNGEDVEGWMSAMTMVYGVDREAIMSTVRVGDRITATVYDGDLKTLHGVEVGPKDQKR